MNDGIVWMTDWEGSPTRVPQAAAATAWLSGFDTLDRALNGLAV